MNSIHWLTGVMSPRFYYINNMKILLWLDDRRNPYDYNYLEQFSPLRGEYKVVWVRSYDEFTKWITKNGLPDGICFDHDLGMQVAISARELGMSKKKSRFLKSKEKTGYDCAKWLVDYCIDTRTPPPVYSIQSANVVGAENIDSLLKNFLKSIN